MVNVLTRRSFVWACGAAAAGWFVPAAGAATRFSYNLSDDFSESEKHVLERALACVADRLCEKHVLANVFQVASAGKVAGGYPEKIGLDPSEVEDRTLLHLLYEMQLGYYLPQVHFPNVQIYRFYERSGYAGYVKGEDVGCVVTKYRARKKEDIQGEFKFYLNGYQFEPGRIGSDEANWASVIAHEMMHCLGHTHAKDEYVDWLQINSVQRAVYTNGKYVRGGKLPPFA